MRYRLSTLIKTGRMRAIGYLSTPLKQQKLDLSVARVTIKPTRNQVL